MVRVHRGAFATDSDSTRQNTSNPAIPKGLRQAGPAIPSRQDATARDSKRPQPATQFATPDDPGLALIVERWGSLPEAVRAGIVAMVRASNVTSK